MSEHTGEKDGRTTENDVPTAHVVTQYALAHDVGTARIGGAGMTGEYQGRSLAWIRTLLGYPAKYASARAAFEDTLRLDRMGPTDMSPPVGSLAWFDTGEHGDVALVVGRYIVLRLSHNGVPEVVRLGSQRDRYLGWSPADVLGPDKPPSTTHTEYGVLLTSPKRHTYLDSTHRTLERAEQHGAQRMLLPMNDDIVTIAKRQVTYALGDWESI